MRSGVLILLAILMPPCLGRGQPPAPAVYAAQRESALAPVLRLLHQEDYVAALTTLRPVLKLYPHDLRVLVLAGETARNAGVFPDALAFYQQAIALNVTPPGALYLGLVRTYSDMNDWEDFNQQRSKVRTLALNGDPTLSVDRGYVIEDYRTGKLHIEVVEFPSMDTAAITRFRFLFPSSHVPGQHFTPSIDLETNPVDVASFAQQFPHQAAAHNRPFALISYPDASTRNFLKFYPDGEPPYEDVHADVFALANKLPTAPNLHQLGASANQKRPTYNPPSKQRP